MTVLKRQTKESPVEQGSDEIIAYTITTTPWGSTPTSVSMVLFDITNGARTDVTSGKTQGSASVNGDIITLPAIKLLTAGSTYRAEVKFTCSGNVFEPYFIVKGKN